MSKKVIIDDNIIVKDQVCAAGVQTRDITGVQAADGFDLRQSFKPISFEPDKMRAHVAELHVYGRKRFQLRIDLFQLFVLLRSGAVSVQHVVLPPAGGPAGPVYG